MNKQEKRAKKANKHLEKALKLLLDKDDIKIGDGFKYDVSKRDMYSTAYEFEIKGKFIIEEKEDLDE